MNVKYLSDGRKVVVVGQLNNQESIVQEIFVTEDGAEIPSGENFTVKSLHDEPVLSYKQKEALQTEKHIEELAAKERKQRAQYAKSYQALRAISEVVRSSEKLVKLLPEADLEIFAAFVTGTIQFLVIDSSYRIEPPVEMIDKIIYWEQRYGDRKFDSIKLVSVLGRSNGHLEYRIHQYSDHSGSSTRVYPFTCRADALAHLKTQAEIMIDKNHLSEKDWQNCINMGLDLSPKHVKAYKKFHRKQAQTAIEHHEKLIDKSKKAIQELKTE